VGSYGRDIPEGKPWYRAIYADDEPVGFIMLGWNVTPDPPRIIGPWFLWKLLVDERYQQRGYGREAVRLVAEIVRANGAEELLTSCLPGDDAPGSVLPANRLLCHGRAGRPRRDHPRAEPRPTAKTTHSNNR